MLQGLVWLMFLSPLLSYITFGVLGAYSFLYYLRPLTIIGGAILIATNARSIVIPKEARFMFLFFLFRLGWNTYINSGLVGAAKFILKSNELSMVMIFIIVANSVITSKDLQRYIKVMKLIVILTVVGSVWQVIDPDFMNAWALRNDDTKYLRRVLGDIYSHRRASIFGYIHPNALGLSFIPTASALIGLLLWQGKQRLALMFLLLAALSAGLSNARYIMAGFVIISFQLLLVGGFRISNVMKYSISVIMAAIVAVIGLGYLGYDFGTWFEERLFAEGDISKNTRVQALFNFLRFFPDAPFLGTGHLTEEIERASNAVGSSHIHVGYLSHLVYYGVVGCSLLFGSWFLLGRKLLTTARISRYWGSFFGFAMFLFAFATMSESSLVFLGIVIGLVIDRYVRSVTQSGNEMDIAS